MVIKDLVVLVDGSPASGARLEWVLAVAARFGARVTALGLVAEPFLPAMVDLPVPAELVQRQLDEAEREMDAILAAASRRAEAHGVRLATSRLTSALELLPSLLAATARVADLVVVGQPDPQERELGGRALAEAAFLGTGRPALLLPYAGKPATELRRILVAWNGSREAARAVHDALPFLTAATQVTVLVIDPSDLDEDEPGAEVAAHLARHGVRVEVRTTPSGGLRVGDVLLSQAADDGADLLVMGGYGRSRLRETILGGATREILAAMTVPVLLSH